MTEIILCDVCGKSTHEPRNPFDKMFVCKRCFYTRMIVYASKNNKISLTLDDMKQIFDVKNAIVLKKL